MGQEGLQQRLQCLEDLMMLHLKSQMHREARLFKYLNGKIDLLAAAMPNIDQMAFYLKLEKLHQELKEQCEKDDEESAKEYDRMRENATITTSQAKDRNSIDIATFDLIQRYENSGLEVKNDK